MTSSSLLEEMYTPRKTAKAIEDVSAWDTHYALKPAAAVYKNLVIDPTSNDEDEDEGLLPPVIGDELLLPSDEDEGLPAVEDNNFGTEEPAGRSFDRATSNVGVPFIPFADFNDWINAQKRVYNVVY